MIVPVLRERKKDSNDTTTKKPNRIKYEKTENFYAAVLDGRFMETIQKVLYTLSLPVNEIEIYESQTHFVKHPTPPTGIACKASLATAPKTARRGKT